MTVPSSELPRVGDRLLDRYRIDAVHRGGMGVLYAVTDSHTGRRYAAKSVPPAQVWQPEVLGRFRQEALTWIELDRHVNLVQALWFLELPQGPLLFLEFVDGPDLAKVLQAGPLPLPRALDLAMQCAAGMAYAHTRPLSSGVGLVHRDLKPSNLLVAPGDVLKISDFGLARVFRRRDGAATEEGIGLGTPEYMAPEQLRAAGSVDGRADIYSFGLVLHECITGSNPLRAGEIQEQLHRILHESPPPLEEAPPELSGLVARCVAKDPADRPRDFGEVLSTLARVARKIQHPWHIDPASIAAPTLPSGLDVTPPALRPRRPRAGEAFGLEVEVQGDLGPGPVELTWKLPAAPGLKVLTPRRSATARLEAGGGARIALRLQLSARKEGRYALPASIVCARGPGGAVERPVPAFEIEIAYAFRLPLCGREAELEQLARALGEAAEGRPRLLLLEGESGSGKSRLLEEATHLAAEQSFRVAHGRAEENDLRPMRILHEAAREILGVPEGEPAALPAARRVASSVQSLLPDDLGTARHFTDALLGQAGVEDETPAAHRWYALFAAAARRGPLALLWDDLHLADPNAAGILLETAARVSQEGLPILMVATSWPIDSEASRTRRGASLLRMLDDLQRRAVPIARLRLRPFTEREVEKLVAAVFPRHGFAEEAPWLIGAIFGQTDGNPFHVAEILRALRLGPGSPVRRLGEEWRFDASWTAERLRELIPGALDAGVRRRVDALAAAPREVLEVAALVGEEFDVALLRAAGEGLEVDRALEALEEAGIIVPLDAELDRYRFWSAVAPAVVERALEERAPRRAKRLHRAVAEGMLAVYRGEAAARRALAVARHLRAAGLGPRSLPHTLDGCERLLALELPERARQLLAEAAPLAEDRGVPVLDRARFQLLYGLACEASGHLTTGLAALTQFLELAVDASAVATPRNLARANTRLGRIHQARGEYDSAQYSFGVARTLLEDVGDRRSLAFCYNSLAALALERGAILASGAYLDTAAALEAETGNEGAAIQTAVLRGQRLLRLEDLVGAQRAFLEAEARAKALDDRKRHAAALEGLGRVALRSGYVARAQRWIQEALELHAQMGDRQGLARTLLQLGEAFRARGRGDRAYREFRRAQRAFEEIGHPEGVALARRQIGLLLRARGRVTTAVKELALASTEMTTLASPDRFACLRELGETLADAASVRAARIALARADRGELPGSGRRTARVLSRAVRAGMHLGTGELRLGRVWAQRALRHAARTSGHAARIAANLACAEVAMQSGDLHQARRCAETAIAFAREQGEPLAEAAAERVLAELAARAGRREEARERSHRAARAYTRRSDASDGPARLLAALGRGLERVDPRRAGRYRSAATSCYARLEAQGFRRSFGS
ncbi:MAG: serine/threonine-protein kinase [Planctomycetaceae bacterium]